MLKTNGGGRERRRSPRVALEAAVDLESGDNFFSGRTRDISSGGLFIETHARLPIGSRVWVKLRLMGRSFDVESVVAWHLEDANGIVGIGVEFVHMCAVGRGAIRAFMETRAPLAFAELDAEPIARLPTPAEPPRPSPRAVGTRVGPPPLPEHR
jgi:uncharacterized protein (TIGR02266 family)